MGELITIKDKQFKPFIDEQRIAEAVSRIALQINEDLKNDFPLFLAVLNGSFMFASDLLKQIHIPCEISFVKMKSYEGLRSTGVVSEMIGLNEDIEGRTVVIVEDIVDSGLTLERMVGLLNEKKVKQIKVATVLFKEKAYKKKHTLNYIGFTIANDFVIGYGLDYNGQGRNLKEIHILA